jgi:hypothetical protein
MIYGPLKCPRRCSECPDGNHHWIPTCVPPKGEVDLDDEEMLTDPHNVKAWENGLEVFCGCKHCDAITDDMGDDDEF